MAPINGEIAFLYLRAVLSGERDAADFVCADVPFERLRLAVLDTGLSAADRAVRLRHALRFAELGLGGSHSACALPMPQSPDWPDAARAACFGLVIRAGRETQALPWKPDWLDSVGADGADAAAMGAELRPWTSRYPRADDWLQRVFGHTHYRGAGQALAVRSALNMPADETLLAVMPTGEGKSLVFQALAEACRGQTVAVVVPTVTLALDHANSIGGELAGNLGRHHAYVGGQDIDNDAILARIPGGDQGLVFSAPESFIGRLRDPLLEAARHGRLAALVIDEAHLVDAWGADFRNEFQLLGALVAELRAEAPAHQQPRIICLSATVTKDAFDTLQILFAPGRHLSIVHAARLRPEIDSWIAQPTSSTDERDARVLEALRHLPRPAVLYLTRQEDAQRWYNLLRETGYARIALVHGGSTTDARRDVVDRWRTGELDLVVGTSAFGLGIDYSHVRTVVHACIPESLDRYYQEVGRSGRDGRAAVSVLVPHSGDMAIARGLARKKIISVEKGFARWHSMFKSAVRDKSGVARFLIDPTVSPGYDPDMQGERNEDWNGRVLSLLAGSGIITMAGLRFAPEKNTTLVVIDILRDDHLHAQVWKGSVEARRKVLRYSGAQRLKDMALILEDAECPSGRLGELYALRQDGDIVHAGLACGGCRHCRADNVAGWFAQWPNAPTAPWAIGNMSVRVAGLLPNGRCFVEYDPEKFDTLPYPRRMTETMEALWSDGLRKFIVLGDAPDSVSAQLAAHHWSVAKGGTRNILSSNGLPAGPEIVWVGTGVALAQHDLAPRSPDAARIYFVPTGTFDPGRPERPLADRFQLVPFSLFYDTLQT